MSEGIIRFIRDVICAPYSIPIGLINKEKPLDMCGITSKKELDIKEVSTSDRAYAGSIGTEREDVSSMTNYYVLSQAIQDILRKNQNIDSKEIEATNIANVTCPLVVPLEEDPNAVYDRRLRKITTEKIGRNGKSYELPVFNNSSADMGGCCPVVDQTTNIRVSSWNESIERDTEEIYNEIDLHIQNNLIEQGSEEASDTEVSVLSSLEIRSVLKQKIREIIRNTSQQNVTISQGLNYTDRYGRCEHVMDRDGKWWYQPKTLQQSIDIDVLSRNIIESTNRLIMKNKHKIDAETTVVVQRITNYRVIVASLLLNIAVCYMIYKLFALFLERIN